MRRHSHFSLFWGGRIRAFVLQWRLRKLRQTESSVSYGGVESQKMRAISHSKMDVVMTKPAEFDALYAAMKDRAAAVGASP